MVGAWHWVYRVLGTWTLTGLDFDFYTLVCRLATQTPIWNGRGRISIWARHPNPIPQPAFSASLAAMLKIEPTAKDNSGPTGMWVNSWADSSTSAKAISHPHPRRRWSFHRFKWSVGQQTRITWTVQAADLGVFPEEWPEIFTKELHLLPPSNL